MALPLVATAEQGVLGATVGTGESGSGDPWDAVVGTPTITYQSEHARGRMAYQVVAGAAAQQLVWTSASVGSVAQIYGRFYLWSHAHPSTPTGVFRFVASGSQTARLRYGNDGTLVLADAGNATEITTAAISTGKLIRVGFRVQFVATNATLVINVYDNPASLTPSDTASISTAAGVGTACDRVEIGSFNSATWTGCLSDIALSATGEPGPIVSTPPVPALRRQTRALLVR
ncbi:hypothetical protein [Actinomadura rugatobispora]|uniref:LamG domain-containing protein n=1 Tax=Actinomadura rugatobispora TaxID=1994 RepID=A0ABW0ZNG3_9ACTN|nr:hypothetical protein GCM10010200_036530 [Actinomadura rugatobispora]